jgi:hypothetical protein
MKINASGAQALASGCSTIFLIMVNLCAHFIYFRVCVCIVRFVRIDRLL